MMQQLIEQSERELVDLVSAWTKASVTGKKELRSALFPDGLVWSHEWGFLNPKNVGLTQDLEEWFQSFGDSEAALQNFLVKIGVPDGI
jgi:hypothetical protein